MECLKLIAMSSSGNLFSDYGKRKLNFQMNKEVLKGPCKLIMLSKTFRKYQKLPLPKCHMLN